MIRMEEIPFPCNHTHKTYKTTRENRWEQEKGKKRSLQDSYAE